MQTIGTRGATKWQNIVSAVCGRRHGAWLLLFQALHSYFLSQPLPSNNFPAAITSFYCVGFTLLLLLLSQRLRDDRMRAKCARLKHNKVITSIQTYTTHNKCNNKTVLLLLFSVLRAAAMRYNNKTILHGQRSVYYRGKVFGFSSLFLLLPLKVNEKHLVRP